MDIPLTHHFFCLHWTPLMVCCLKCQSPGVNFDATRFRVEDWKSEATASAPCCCCHLCRWLHSLPPLLLLASVAVPGTVHHWHCHTKFWRTFTSPFVISLGTREPHWYCLLSIVFYYSPGHTIRSKAQRLDQLIRNFSSNNHWEETRTHSWVWSAVSNGTGSVKWLLLPFKQVHTTM